MNHKNQQPHYGMRKLSVGFVSCLLGFSMVAGLLPTNVYALSESKGEEYSTNMATQAIVYQSMNHRHVDTKSSASSDTEKEIKNSLEYNQKKCSIKWKRLKKTVSDIDGISINGRSLRKGSSDEYLREGYYFYEKGKIYINPGLRLGDKVEIKVKGKNHNFEYKQGRLYPFQKPQAEGMPEYMISSDGYGKFVWKLVERKTVDGLSINGNSFRKVEKYKYLKDGRFYQENDRIYFSPRLKGNANIDIKIGNKTYKFTLKDGVVKPRQNSQTDVDATSEATQKYESSRNGYGKITWDLFTKIHIEAISINNRHLNRVNDDKDLSDGHYYLNGKTMYIRPRLRNGDEINIKIEREFIKLRYNDGKLDILFVIKKPKDKIKVGNIKELTRKEKEKILSEIKKLNPKATVTFNPEDKPEYAMLYFSNNSRGAIRLLDILVEEEKTDLTNVKEEARATIDLLDELTKDEKTEAKTSIDDAKDKDAVDKVLEQAQQTNTDRVNAKDALKQAKEAAKKEVDSLPYLGKQSKDDFKGQVDKFGTVGEVDNIVIKAKEQNAEAKKALNEKKKSGKNDIDHLPNLNEDEKKGFKGQIDQASDKDAVDTIVNEAKVQADEALKQAKDKAKKEIDNLSYLGKEAKNDFKGQVDKATTKGEVDNIVIKAKEQNVEAKKALDEKKESGKKEIDNLPNLNEDKKKDFKDKIDEASDEGTVDKIVNEAKEKNKKSTEDEDLADLDEVNKAKEELQKYMKSVDEKVLDSESIEFKGNDRKEAKDAVQKAKDLLAKDKITKKELKFIQSIPYREVNGKKTGLFRKFTKKALVNYKVEGDRDQINPHNNKKYVALKNNEIKIQSNLKGAKKIGENEKAFFKLNYVTNEQYAAHNNVAKPMAVSFRSAQVDAASTATPKYKKQEVPRENYEVKAVDGGYEITIKQLPENVKYIKPIVYVKFADQTYFENGDMVAVTAAVEPNSEDQTPVIPSKPDVSHESGSSSTDSGYIFLEPVATVQRESSKPSEPTKQAEAPKAKHGAYIYGYGDDCFRPNGKISRAEAASMIAYLAGLDMSQKDKANFADTPSAWYNAAINAMVKNNLMLADKNGNFRPDEPITRAEFARALAGIDKKSDRVASFTDVKGHEFEDAINQAFGNGHIVGYPDGTFRPDGAITRAEAVTILNHFDGRSMDKHDLQKIRMNFKSFKDVEERHWAYVQILLAANNFQEMKDALGNR
ncbi:S-layer homology domain-containing protein [Aedoeadaptatus coxii]|uniref:S-layer homology domain-containing protein n=1 Tax=Aedoeadaptatus coxii TaxID=755172 RepID=UPI002AD3D76D|nr:S-layer homology domain-containing protein [Peptoniphilus coxii]